MIDCKIHVERKSDPKGDRAVISFEYVFSSTIKSIGNTKL